MLLSRILSSGPAPRMRRVATSCAMGLLALQTVASAPLSAQPPRLLRAPDLDTLPLRHAGLRIAYGPDSLQFGELRLPPGAEQAGPSSARFPVAIVIHGGCWLSRYAAVRNGAPMADALAAEGIATWNVEYRRYDHPGGGWPGTLLDVADATDFVRTLARRYPVDTTRLVVIGHSAGGHLALWLASRRTLATTSPLYRAHPIALRAVASVGGIADLREFFGRERQTCGNPAVESLLGGVPDSVPQRLRDASPIERLPLGVPSLHIAGARDQIAPESVRATFVAAARASGDRADVVTVPGGHFEPMAPATEAGQELMRRVRALLGLPDRGTSGSR